MLPHLQVCVQMTTFIRHYDGMEMWILFLGIQYEG
jgi:hypothetical protein